MKNHLEPATETPARQSSYHDFARHASQAAQKRHLATRNAIAECLDRPVLDCSIPDLNQQAEVAASDHAPAADPYTRISQRTLLLADSLQRHALMRIAETGLMLDEIDRAVLGRHKDGR